MRRMISGRHGGVLDKDSQVPDCHHCYQSSSHVSSSSLAC